MKLLNIGVLALLAAACAGEPDTGSRAQRATLGELWEPTTVPFDPSCEQVECAVVDTVEVAHDGSQVELRELIGVDDPLVQWATCIDSVIGCLAGGGDVLGCTQDSTCPSACIAALEEAAATLVTEPEVQQAFFELFIAPTALCQPTIAEIVESNQAAMAGQVQP